MHVRAGTETPPAEGASIPRRPKLLGEPARPPGDPSGVQRRGGHQRGAHDQRVEEDAEGRDGGDLRREGPGGPPRRCRPVRAARPVGLRAAVAPPTRDTGRMPQSTPRAARNTKPHTGTDGSVPVKPNACGNSGAQTPGAAGKSAATAATSSAGTGSERGSTVSTRKVSRRARPPGPWGPVPVRPPCGCPGRDRRAGPADDDRGAGEGGERAGGLGLPEGLLLLDGLRRLGAARRTGTNRRARRDEAVTALRARRESPRRRTIPVAGVRCGRDRGPRRFRRCGRDRRGQFPPEVPWSASSSFSAARNRRATASSESSKRESAEPAACASGRKYVRAAVLASAA
ncbi:hypothetical protein SGRIM128S_01485 [Streptomyces griseomycini]